MNEPCPFCGADFMDVSSDKSQKATWVTCKSCGTSIRLIGDAEHVLQGLSKTPKLKSCPFCGGVGAVKGDKKLGAAWVICENGCRTSTNCRKTIKEAIEAWNRRDAAK